MPKTFGTPCIILRQATTVTNHQKKIIDRLYRDTVDEKGTYWPALASQSEALKLKLPFLP